MVTSYYIMKMNTKKIINTEEYYSRLQNAPSLARYNKNKHLKCRVCLQNGDILIADAENVEDIKHVLKTYGEIDDQNSDDDIPKYLCNICYTFIKSAILFRIIAQQTNDTLKNVEVLSPEDDEDSFNEDKPNSVYEDFPPTPKPPIPPKVQCPVCKKIVNKRYYEIHITMHNPKYRNQYVCDKCGKSFRLRVGYYKHLLRHRTDYAFKCHICPFKARYEESLKRHMQSHIRNYKYLCNECPARFLYKSNMNYHIMVKHREPQHKCQVCDKEFHIKLHLERHNDVVHLGNKSHICNTCGRAFGYRKLLTKHQIRVHKREKLKLRFSNSNYKLLNDNKE